MKIYTVFIYDIDNEDKYSHFVGSFDSEKSYQKALEDIEKEFNITFNPDDYAVHTTELNKNLVI